jgi:2-oxoglutarate dehydrogenase E2 component (dihydrolipoamide succinyltransferase)
MPSVPVKVPSVGESITEGILAHWMKADGEAVLEGDSLYELETDKASSVFPAPSSGVLKIAVAEGDTVAIGATIGTIDPAGTPKAATPKAPAAAPAAPTPSAGRAANTPAAPAADEQAKRPAAPAAATARARGDGAGNQRLSPAVRRIVAEEAVDVARVAPTGPGGRVTKRDVLAYLDERQPTADTKSTSAPAAADAPAPSNSSRTAERETRQRMSGLRQRIAQRLVEVQQTAAILTTFNEADMSRVIDLRTQYKEAFQKKHGVALGFMSIFVKAVIEALKAFPTVNGRIEGNEIVLQNYFDIGVAVSTERGLMVPVIRDADQLSFAAIEKTIGGFATKAREGTISVGDLKGGTFTITNGGIFGSLLSTPIINPPQSGILGMHAIKKRPVVVDDQIVIRPMMYLALSYDHRLIDGREAVSFLVKVKDCVENPERILFEI